MITLLLALADQFVDGMNLDYERAREILPRVDNEYQRLFYDGIICELRAKAQLEKDTPGSRNIAYDWFRKAMQCHEKAMNVRPEGTDDAILRWNTCARIIMRNSKIVPADDGTPEPMLE